MAFDTKEEFYSYVDSLIENKPLYNFSEEEIYKIGLEHKALPNKEKNWQVLADYIRYFSGCGVKNGEALRQFIISKQREDGTLPSKDLKKAMDNSEFENDYTDAVKIRDIYNAYRSSLRSSARVDSLKETILQCAKQQAKFPIKLSYYTKSKEKENGEAILLLGDWHIGQLVDNFYNKYNLDIAKERISKIINETIQYCHRLNVKRLNIINLGDLIEGIINPNGRINQQDDVCSQLMYASELMANALYQLQEAAPEVTYRSCLDNHSRLLSDKHQNIEIENLSRITDWYVEERLKGTSVKIVKDNLDPGFGKFKLENNMNVVFFHGHEDSKSQTLQNVVGATHEWIDIVCCGHWHNPAEHTYQNMKLFVNNSLCGTGDYALSRRLFTKPSQKLIIIENNSTIDIDIGVE